ncbi:MAG: NADH-quinone oxidoreductase subunit NuoD, partial [Anaerolineae bacterium]|nr:NADH-quinone oxidoreductase subunit NuoD [Anaerolineae bacterium]
VQYPKGFDPNPELWQPLPEVDIKVGSAIDVSGLDTEQILLNIGPHHPSTHGVFRMVASLQGETVTSLYPVVGHLHRNQ